LLTLRFGDLPADLVARIEGASPEKHSTWIERVLTAQSIEDIFA